MKVNGLKITVEQVVQPIFKVRESNFKAQTLNQCIMCTYLWNVLFINKLDSKKMTILFRHRFSSKLLIYSILCYADLDIQLMI